MYNDINRDGEGGPLAMENFVIRHKAHKPSSFMGIECWGKINHAGVPLIHNSVYTGFMGMDIFSDFDLTVIFKPNGFTCNSSAVDKDDGKPV